MRCCWTVDLASPHWKHVASALLCAGALAACESAALAGTTAPETAASARESAIPLRVALVVDGQVSKGAIRTMQRGSRAHLGPLWCPDSVAGSRAVDGFDCRRRGAGGRVAALSPIAGGRRAGARMLPGGTRGGRSASAGPHRVPQAGGPAGPRLDRPLRRALSCGLARDPDGEAAGPCAGSRARPLSSGTRAQCCWFDAPAIRLWRYLGRQGGTTKADPPRGRAAGFSIGPPGGQRSRPQ